MCKRKKQSVDLIVKVFAALGLAISLQSTALAAPYSFDAGQLTVTLNASGQISSLKSKIDNTEYVDGSHVASLIQLVANGSQQLPSALTYDATNAVYQFQFAAISTEVDVKVVSKANYATLQVTAVNAPTNVDVAVLMWGPITTNITQTVGETVGLVYNDKFAIGIHGLNDKTIGGWPYEWDSLNSYYHAGSDAAHPFAFEWNSAATTSSGSILQAYTYDATKYRYRWAGWASNVLEAPLPGPDGQIPGSTIALFGCGTAHTLNTLFNMETAEGLPQPVIDGQWQKTAQATSQTFLVLNDLSTSNAAQAAQYANQAGVNYIYSLIGANGPWNTNGHFQFNSQFGGSDAGATGLVNTAESYGVHVGVHTLSVFVDPGDPYITPVPDSGLASIGTALLTRSLDTSATDVYVSSNLPSSSLGSVLRIDNELVSYSTITAISSTEWKFSGGSRGIWGTGVASHAVNATVSDLIKNEYGGLAGGISLVAPVAARLSTIFNTTGIKAMSFDGLESIFETGYETYAGGKLVGGMVSQLNNENSFITEASNIYPNTWDVQSRISLGEEGNGTPISDVYAHNSFYARNFLPPMMGWFVLNSSLVSAEWHLSKMASWNAGTGFQTSVGGLSGMSPAILDAIKQWEAARNAGAFTASQKAAMRDTSTYWHLSVVTPGIKWSLQQTDSNGANIGSAQDVYASYHGLPQYSDLARNAVATASSSYYNGCCGPANAIDGNGSTTWASAGETNPWIQLNWNTSQTINTITFFDRGDGAEAANGGTLTFSDNTSISVSGIPHDGSPITVTLPTDKTVTWLKFQVVGGSGSNVGLQAIQVFDADRNAPQENDMAQSAVPTASSSYYSGCCAPANAIDGTSGTQWASNGELNPWFQLNWAAAQTFNTIVLFDRGDGGDYANGGTLTFSDGTSVPVTGIPHDGSAYTVTLPTDKTATWVKFQVSGGAGYNVGLQEFQVFETANVARIASASASSTFSSSFMPGNAIDGNGATEWASHGELNPWIALDWSSNQLINKITFYDRQNSADWAPGGTLTFSDGSSLTVTGIPNNGSPYSVTFPDKNVTWVKFQVTNGSGYNVGLQEIQVFSRGIRVVPVTDVAISPNPVTLYRGQSYVLTATVFPTNASSTSVKWSSSNPGVATVDQGGNVTALANGTTTITVTTADGKTDTGTVTVTDPVAVQSISLSPSQLTESTGAIVNLNPNVTIIPSNTSNKKLTWTSSNTSAATVVNGFVRVLATGSAVITAASADGSQSATCTIVVPVDIAPLATATASSSFPNGRYPPTNAIDGNSGTQWASNGELNPWIQLNWASAQTINTLVFFDRGDGADFANGGTLTFSDNTSVSVSGIPHDGSPLTVTLPSPKTVTWLKFQVTSGSGYGNTGLQEIQVFP